LSVYGWFGEFAPPFARSHLCSRAELLGWFKSRHRWRYLMRLRADTWIKVTATEAALVHAH
jgi:hypothetical protein